VFDKRSAKPFARRRVWGLTLGATAALVIFACAVSGCVHVATIITSRGFVHREFAVTVDAVNGKAVRQRLNEVFRGWDIRTRAQNDQVTFTCVSTREQDTPEDFPGMTLTMERNGSERAFTYAERIDVLSYLGGEASMKAFEDATVTIRVTMPGKITRCPKWGSSDGSTATLECKVSDLDGRTIEVASTMESPDRAFLMAILVILIGGAIASFLSSDAPRKLRDRYFG